MARRRLQQNPPVEGFNPDADAIVYDVEGQPRASFDTHDSLQGNDNVVHSNLRVLRAEDHEDLSYSEWNLLTSKYRYYSEPTEEQVERIAAAELVFVGGNSVYLRTGTVLHDETLSSLDGYPLLDDDDHNELEGDQLDEEWERFRARATTLPEWWKTFYQEQADTQREGEPVPEPLLEIVDLEDVRLPEHSEDQADRLMQVINHVLHEEAHECRNYNDGELYIDWHCVSDRITKQKGGVTLVAWSQGVAQYLLQELSEDISENVEEHNIVDFTYANLKTILTDMADYVPDLDLEELDEFVLRTTRTDDSRPAVSSDWADLAGQLMSWWQEENNHEATKVFVHTLGEVLKNVLPFTANEFLSYVPHRRKNPGRPSRRGR